MKAKDPLGITPPFEKALDFTGKTLSAPDDKDYLEDLDSHSGEHISLEALQLDAMRIAQNPELSEEERAAALERNQQLQQDAIATNNASTEQHARLKEEHEENKAKRNRKNLWSGVGAFCTICLAAVLAILGINGALDSHDAGDDQTDFSLDDNDNDDIV